MYMLEGSMADPETSNRPPLEIWAGPTLRRSEREEEKAEDELGERVSER